MAQGLDHDSRSLTVLLDRLARALATLRDDLQAAGAPVEVWSDLDHHYLDAPASVLAHDHVDVCVSEGRVFLVAVRHDGEA